MTRAIYDPDTGLWEPDDSEDLPPFGGPPDHDEYCECDPCADDRCEGELEFNRDVSGELRRLKIRKAAQQRLRAESEPDDPPDMGTLAELLARPPEPPARVEGLIPWKAGTLLVAQRKTGKTTLILNLARSLITGEPFLGRFPVRPIDKHSMVGVLNYEVSGHTFAKWADEVGVPADRMFVVNLRGRRNPLATQEGRNKLVRDLNDNKHIATLIVDPFGRAYPGTSQNDPGEVGAFLADLDRLASDIASMDLILTAHAGWNGERTRGSSALEDWADSIITMTRDAEDESQRFLRAIGRDVEVEEDQLNFDQTTRALTLAGVGSRKQAASTRHLEDLLPAVLAAVRRTPGLTGNQLDVVLRESGEANFRKGDGAKAARLGVSRCLLTTLPGPRNATHFHPTPSGEVTAPGETAGQAVPRTSPRPPQGSQNPPPPPPLYGEVGGGEDAEAPPPQQNRSPCSACGFPLDPSITQDGFTTHPTCSKEAS